MKKETLFGENFKKYRKKKGVSQKEFALLLFEATGKQLTLTSVSNYETGLHLPPPQILPVIADILGVSIDALFGVEKTSAVYGLEKDTAAKVLEQARREEERQELERLLKGFRECEKKVQPAGQKEAEILRGIFKRLLKIAEGQQEELFLGQAQLALVRKMIEMFKRQI